jgi:hypothetical protein
MLSFYFFPLLTSTIVGFLTKIRRCFFSKDFYVVRTVHFGMKLYNDKRNAQVFNLFIYFFCLACFGLSFSPSSEASVQLRQWFTSPGYGLSARALTPYPGDLNHGRSCTQCLLKKGLKKVQTCKAEVKG